MTLLSRKARYAIMGLTVLAREYGRGPVPMSSISRDKSIPLRFLEGIFLQLKRKGILGSVRGVDGGYYLLREPSKVRVLEVIEEMDGPLTFVSCADLCGDVPKCEFGWDLDSCKIRSYFSGVRSSISKELASASLADLV